MYGTPRIVLPLLVVLVLVCPLLLPSGVVWYSRVFLSGLEEDLGTEVVFWFILHQTNCLTHHLRLLLATLDSVLCGSDGNFSCTSVSCAPTPSDLRHYGVFDGTILLRRVSWRWRPRSAWLGVVGLKIGWDRELSSGLMFLTFMSVQFFQVRLAPELVTGAISR